jgi:hypothetical protein
MASEVIGRLTTHLSSQELDKARFTIYDPGSLIEDISNGSISIQEM